MADQGIQAPSTAAKAHDAREKLLNELLDSQSIQGTILGKGDMLKMGLCVVKPAPATPIRVHTRAASVSSQTTLISDEYIICTECMRQLDLQDSEPTSTTHLLQASVLESLLICF